MFSDLIFLRYASSQQVLGVISSRTQTNADVFVLKKKHLDVVLSHYPQIRKQIIETAEERQRLVRERAEAAAKKKEEERKKQEELERQKTIKELESADRESTKQEGTFPDSENKNEGVSSNQEVSKGSFLKELIFAS